MIRETLAFGFQILGVLSLICSAGIACLCLGSEARRNRRTQPGEVIHMAPRLRVVRDEPELAVWMAPVIPLRRGTDGEAA